MHSLEDMKKELQTLIIFGLITLIISICSCTTVQEINGFGGGDRNFSSKTATNSQTPYFQNKVATIIHNIHSLDKFDTLDYHQKTKLKASIQNINSDQKSIILKNNIKSKSPANNLKTRILTKLLTNKLEIQKYQILKTNDFLPDRESEFGYWLLFIYFCFFAITAIPLLLTNDMYVVAFGFISLIISLVPFFGLLTYDKLDECGFLYNFGFWTSMFGFWLFGIPLLIWILGALLCDS